MRSPVPQPRMIWAVGINYRDHTAETGRELPAAPTLFAKAPGSTIGPGEPIVVPPHVKQPDYEGELTVVIGRQREGRAARARARLRRRAHDRARRVGA